MPNEILGRGHMSSDGPGVLRGKATFPVRGEFEMKMYWLHKRGAHWYARLSVGGVVREIIEFPDMPPGCDPDRPAGDVRHWHTIMPVDGYDMRVRAERADSGMTVTFYDTPQPIEIVQ
jgi:hypothetical protein